METIHLTSDTLNNFASEVSEATGQDMVRCYQCGNCTAGCPYTEFFDYPVSQIMRMIQTGQREKALSSKAIWLCATCETCSTRCPCEIDVADVMDGLRNIAYREKRFTEKDIRTFYEAFLTSLRNHGRIFELEIIARYNLKSGHLLTDADLGPKVMKQLHFLPKRIKGRENVARIVKRFMEKR
ncbi:MAG TPA: 4Fe-4S dicluster domain-containing protein [Syntrophorhabdales bacterium]|nr:4Fe-4S dicluster domain-containing protein [Syntrophorhabdales bacterium]